MILPGSLTLSILLLILSLLCWGFWTSTFKLAGKWRFELYYFDFAMGAVVLAGIAALTLGNMGWDGFSIVDDLRNAGKRQDLFAFIAGAIFNLGNMLLLAAVSLAGLSVAFPLAAGLALVIGAIWNFVLHPGGSALFLGLGAVALAAAIVMTAIAYKNYLAQVKKEAPAPVAAKGKRVKPQTPGKAILIALAGGVLLGSFYPFVDMARGSELGLGPYSLTVVFTLGMAFTTFVYNLFFMNLPVKGEPVDFGEYFKGSGKQHGMGFLGGALWALGALAAFVAWKAEGAAQPGPVANYAFVQGAPLLATLLGLVWWKEFPDSDGRVKTLLFVMLVFFATGLGALALAPNAGLR